ncbi:hypothetical protein [Christensenella intestinihominis]|uniref:hypothetical protein n=1 Tax=Christensenella intestinihominis TaxID=1851429 RepID=UPI00082FB605|nr:hypothetical protein [Christensenella intestinihominis]
MIRLNQEQINFIKENFENWEELLNSTDRRPILKALHLFIDREGFDEFYNLNDLGREAQRVYDSIYCNN